MRLGKNERQLLYEIDIHPKDMVLGFLCSAGSVSLMYKAAYKSARQRQEKQALLRDLKQRRKRMIQKLEKKGLITLYSHGNKIDDKTVVKVTSRAQEYLEIQKIFRKTKPLSPWDQQWTLIMFDIPTQENLTRNRLTHILQRIGFEQVQLSVYAYPYEVPNLENFLVSNKKYGQYCHIFRGKYMGDDTNLRKEFNL